MPDLAARQTYNSACLQTRLDAKRPLSPALASAAGQRAAFGALPDLDTADAWKIKDRRQRERYRIAVEVSVISAFGNDSAMVCDVSVDGAGLAGACGLSRKQLVVIEHAGRLVPARVRWSSGDRCGVQFLSPLAKDDPLLTRRPAMISGRLASDLLQVSPNRKKAPRTMMTSAISRLAAQATQWWTARGEARRVAREAIMIERACREQGYAWLVDDEQPAGAVPSDTAPSGRRPSRQA